MAAQPQREAFARVARFALYPLVVGFSLWATDLLLNYLPLPAFPVATAAVSVAVIGIAVLLEWRWPFRRDWTINRGDLVTDIVQTNIVLPLVSKLAEMLLFWVFGALLWSAGRSLPTRALLDGWPLLVRLAVLTLIAEFFYYWLHRWMHRIGGLWRFHAVHHGCERVYWANSGRFHALDMFVSSLFYLLPFAVLSDDAHVLGLFYTLTAVTGLFEHLNVDYRGGWLNYVFNTAQLHRVHHSLNPQEMNSNYGKILCVWDHVFGTWHLPEHSRTIAVGLSNAKPVPTSLWGQIVYPFKRVQTP